MNQNIHSVFQQLSELLNNYQISFTVSRHQPVFTSKEAADVRGCELKSGAKALICKADDRFVMFVMPADRRLASKQVRQTQGIRKLRFATLEEVWDQTRLKPGSIPPFGSLFQLPTWCDQALSNEPQINFNAGDHAISISMAFKDFVTVESPRLGQFTETS